MAQRANVVDIGSDLVRTRAEQDEAQRRQDMVRAVAYYNGMAPKQLVVKPGDHDDNVRLGYPQIAVDVSVAFLFGDNVGMTAEDESVQDIINAAWGTDEQRMMTLGKLGIDGACNGHVFVKLVPLDGGATRLVCLDPQTVSVEWEPDDYHKVRRYRIEWVGFDESLGKAVAYRQTIRLLADPDEGMFTSSASDQGPWEVTDERSVGGSGWTLAREPWVFDYPFPPIVDTQNLPVPNEYYGVPDLTPDALDLVDAINMAASNIQKILRYHAHPKVYVSGFSGKSIDMTADTVLQFPSETTRIDVLGMGGDLPSAFLMLDQLKQEFMRRTRTPLAAVADPVAAYAASSGLALKLGFMPLVDKTGQKRDTYGYLLNEINQRIQVIAGREPSEVELDWPSITPDDPLSEAQVALMRQQLGVPKSTLLAELGYDPEIEMTKADDEAEASLEAMQRTMQLGAGLPPPGQDNGGVAGEQRRTGREQRP